MKSLPPSAAQTGHTVFPYPAFMKNLIASTSVRGKYCCPKSSGMNGAFEVTDTGSDCREPEPAERCGQWPGTTGRLARKLSSQATASYDLAMAQHMLASGEFEKLKMHLETMKAGANARRADARRQLPRLRPTCVNRCLRPTSASTDSLESLLIGSLPFDGIDLLH
jgi:hypothetical protein